MIDEIAGALNIIQKEIKAPKGQTNAFGKYKYRSCEDILEAVKPLLGKAVLVLCDDIVLIGDRYYVKATATLTVEGGGAFIATAFARESLDKKGMDSAQITGAASSYARKYALNGLFCIDDTKDADAGDNAIPENPKAKPAPPRPEDNKGATPSPAMDLPKRPPVRTAAMEKTQKIMAELYGLYTNGEPEVGYEYNKAAFTVSCKKVLGYLPETAEDKEKLEAELPADCAQVWLK